MTYITLVNFYYLYNICQLNERIDMTDISASVQGLGIYEFRTENLQQNPVTL